LPFVVVVFGSNIDIFIDNDDKNGIFVMAQ